MSVRPRLVACAAVLLVAGLLQRPVLAQLPAPHPAASAAASGLPVQLPLRREEQEGSVAGFGWRAIALLLLVGGAGGWLLWRRGVLLRVAAGPRSVRDAHGVQRLSSQALTPQASVHSLCWHGEELLLGCTAQQVTVLARRRTDAPGEERA